MRNYVKRINQKKDKLSKDQLLLLIDDVIEENDVLNSIINSLSTGILIVDKDFKLASGHGRARSGHHNGAKRMWSVVRRLER